MFAVNELLSELFFERTTTLTYIDLEEYVGGRTRRMAT